MKEVQGDEVLFEKIDEHLVTVAIAPTSLSQVIGHNVMVFNENLS